MKLGIIADVHGDLAGLQAALDRLDRLPVDKVVCAGDLVGNASFSDEVVDLVRARGLPTVRGNWDAWAVGRGRPDEPRAPASGKVWDALGLDLSKGSLHWLAHLPADWRQAVDGVSVCMGHGMSDANMRGVFPDTKEMEAKRLLVDLSLDTRVVILGHTHVPMCRKLDARILCNPGAVCRAMGGTYGVLNGGTLSFHVYHSKDGSELHGGW